MKQEEEGGGVEEQQQVELNNTNTKTSKRLRPIEEERVVGGGGGGGGLEEQGMLLRNGIGVANNLSSSVKSGWQDPVHALASVRHEFGEHGGVNMSIEASATFTVMEPETLGKLFSGELGPSMDFYIYSRHFNPTILNLSRQLAALEGTEAAYCTSSGMSAISSVLLQLCDHGDHIVASGHLYGGTFALLSHFLPRTCGITTTFIDIFGEDAEAEIRAALPSARVLYLESISNPTLSVADIPRLSAIAREVSAAQRNDRRRPITVVVDNTFAPVILSPARLGADVVVHSISKYISGGADVIAGAVCGPATLIDSMMGLQQGALMLLGPTMNPNVAFGISERIPHLALRMKEHCHRALTYATRLQSLGLKVIYPGLEEHPQHHLFKRLANAGYGYGGMMGIHLGTKERAYKFIHYLQNHVQFGFMAVSLGYYETLMSCPGSSTSSELSVDEQERTGISPGLVRMSVGYTGTLEQRWNQLLEALTTLDLIQPNTKRLPSYNATTT